MSITPDYTALVADLNKLGLDIRLALLSQPTPSAYLQLLPQSEAYSDEDEPAYSIEFAIRSYASDLRDRQGASGWQAIRRLRESLFATMPSDATGFYSINWLGGTSLPPEDRFWIFEDRFTARYEAPPNKDQLNDYLEISIDET